MAMPFLKLMIADGAQEIRQTLEEMFADRCIVKTCADGEAAMELLQQFLPDILVLDLMLPKVDGLTLLQQLRQMELKTMVLAQTSVDSIYVQERLQKLNVDYVLMKPCHKKALEVRILDFMALLQDAPPQPQNENHLIANVLMTMSFSAKLDGYSYLVDAIPLFAKDTTQSITKELYVAVGQLRRKDPTLVERSIRSAIDKAWKNRDEQVWRQYFRCAPNGTVPRPSNGDFIARMAQVLFERTKDSHIA